VKHKRFEISGVEIPIEFLLIHKEVSYYCICCELFFWINLIRYCIDFKWIYLELVCDFSL